MPARIAPLPETPPGRAIGLFGGTFNPVHTGHIASAMAVRVSAALDVVYLIPARIPPHKNAWDLPAPEHRVAMLRAAIAETEGLALCDIELARDGPSYTVDTLTLFRERWGDAAALSFIMGMDTFREVTTWSRYTDLFRLADVIVTTRPGSPRVTPEEVFPVEVAGEFVYSDGRYHTPGGRLLEFMTIPEIPVSATDIRRRVHAGESITDLVPPGAETYIRAHGLYR